MSFGMVELCALLLAALIYSGIADAIPYCLHPSLLVSTGIEKLMVSFCVGIRVNMP
jgi:hypothetical protein